MAQNDIMIAEPKYTHYDPDESESWKDLEYSVYPISQLRPLEINAVVYNLGNVDQTGVYLEVHITSDNGFDETLTSASVNLPPAVPDTLFIPPFTPPNEVGEYTLEYSVHMDAQDESPENNSAERTFSVSEAEFARDIGYLTGVGETGEDDSYFAAGPGFHFTEDVEIHCLGGVISSDSELGGWFAFALHEYDESSLNYAIETIPTFTTEDNVSDFLESNWVWLSFYNDEAFSVSEDHEFVPMFQHYGTEDIAIGTGGWAPDVTNLLVADFGFQICDPCYSNNTYMVRIGLSEEFCESVVTPEIEWIDVSGAVFYDENCDGTFNGEDQGLEGQLVFDEDMTPVAMTNHQGNYSLELMAGEEHTLSVPDLPGFTVNNVVINEDEIPVIENANFGYCVENENVDLGVSISPTINNPIPGQPLTNVVCVTNYGSVASSGELTFDFSDMPGITIVDADGGQLNESTIEWEIGDLGIFESVCFEVSMELADETPNNTILSAWAEVVSSEDSNSSNDTHLFDQLADDEFETFRKTVDKPVINYTELQTGEVVQLDYTIHFQNTGDATVSSVRVTDELPELLDISTLQMIDVSHDYEVLIHSSNDIEWVFDEIMLPDSSTNLAESYVKIHFRINAVEGVNVDDIIENQARIYFDDNIAGVTYFAETAFLDCSEGSLEIFGADQACLNAQYWAVITNHPTAHLFNSFVWEIDGEETEATFLILPVTETPVPVTLTVSNSVCELSVTDTLHPIEVPEVEVLHDFDVLYSSHDGESYVWLFEGVLIDGETSSSLVPQQNGTYELMVTFESGCTASAEIIVLDVGLDELNQIEIELFPNPAKGFTTLVATDLINNIELTNISGKIIYQHNNLATNRFDLDLSSLAPGLYFVRVEAGAERLVKKLVVE